MSRATQSILERDRRAVRRRVRQMCEWFNREQWDKCFLLIDPNLRAKGRVAFDDYVAKLAAFKRSYGEIQPWHIKLSLRIDGTCNKLDSRPFAYVYVVWKDDHREFHLFRERWVKDADQWYTRVVGLVPNRQPA